MMTVPMDKSSAPSSRELAQRLFAKNIELENGLRKSAQSRVPSDPNAWLQMRENYETIILEDHEFSERHEVEVLLWQLHYRRIEEFRVHINAAKSAGSVASQGNRSTVRPDRIKKIRSAFKSFLSEATGFYHDLILKIRAKYGLPLGYFSESPECQIILTKDEKKSAEMKKGLMSSHRCLIYLGDLARYKGMYGEGEAASRDYSAASSYYIQAASFCPSSGNPHHQLAILASYSGDDLTSVYRYFRSLAAGSPFSTARDNLIIAFEKNRQSFSQLLSNDKSTPAKPLAARSNARGRGKGDARLMAKDTKTETPVKEQELSTSEIFKAFTTRFVRLNGVLFTRTSLETFGEIFSLVTSNLLELLSSGPEEELNFGSDAAENGLVILRLVAILIFTVHNVNRESESKSYAEILQCTVLLQNAFTAAFEFAGHIIKRCIQLHDALSSYLVPAILVFIEWLACHPDIAAGNDVEEKQVTARSYFWNNCVSFMNKLLLSGHVSMDNDEDETCFLDMSQYDEGETGNRLALWEDFELRGFIPLVPAQLILDFSRKHAFGSDGNKEKTIRAQRILAAGRALMSVVRVGQQGIYFDSQLKRFIIGIEPPEVMYFGFSDAPELNVIKKPSPVEGNVDFGVSKTSTLSHGMIQPKIQLHVDREEEEEEEEIVFKPTIADKYPSVGLATSTACGTIPPVQISSNGGWETYSTPLSTALNNLQLPAILNATSHTTTPNFSQQPLQHVILNTSTWQESLLSDGLRNLNIIGNGLPANHMAHDNLSALHARTFSPLVPVPANPSTASMLSGQTKVVKADIPSTLDSIVPSVTNDNNGLAMKLSSAQPMMPRKSPVSRPVRHLGPPPGFSHVSSKLPDDISSHPIINEQLPQIDDYSWLDGYQSSSTKHVGMENSIDHATHFQKHVSDTDTSNIAMNFPFPGKLISGGQTEVANDKKWQDFQLFEHLKPYPEQQLQQANMQPSLLPEQHQAQSIWSGRYFV